MTTVQMTTVQTSPMLHVTLPRAATLTDVLLSPPDPRSTPTS